MNLTQIKHAMRMLSLAQLRKLDECLHELIRKDEEAALVKEQPSGNKTYRLERISCGKENCKCARGKLHGPYWYSYTRVKDKVTSQYIGKILPKEIENKLKSRKEK